MCRTLIPFFVVSKYQLKNTNKETFAKNVLGCNVRDSSQPFSSWHRSNLASIVPPQKEQETRTPVITGHDGNVLDVTQVLDDLHFEVVNLYSSNQYCNIRMLETCVHRVLHDQPGRLWFGRGLGRFNNKICDVQRQIDQGSVSSLFLTFAPKKHLVEKEVRVRGNMPALRTFLND